MSRTSQLQDVTETDNQIRQLAPVLDEVELPFQGLPVTWLNII